MIWKKETRLPSRSTSRLWQEPMIFLPFTTVCINSICAIILYCRAGRGTMAIDLKKYEITVNTQVVLLPGAVISLDERRAMIFRSPFFASHIEMFREACIRF